MTRNTKSLVAFWNKGNQTQLHNYAIIIWKVFFIERVGLGAPLSRLLRKVAIQVLRMKEWMIYLVLMFFSTWDMLAWLFFIRWPSSQITRSGPGLISASCSPGKLFTYNYTPQYKHNRLLTTRFWEITLVYFLLWGCRHNRVVTFKAIRLWGPGFKPRPGQKFENKNFCFRHTPVVVKACHPCRVMPINTPLYKTYPTGT